MQSFSALIRNDIYDHLATRAVVNRRVGRGATGKSAVESAIAAAEKRLD
jgi:argininosuccinate lyase